MQTRILITLLVLLLVSIPLLADNLSVGKVISFMHYPVWLYDDPMPTVESYRTHTQIDFSLDWSDARPYATLDVWGVASITFFRGSSGCYIASWVMYNGEDGNPHYRYIEDLPCRSMFDILDTLWL